MKLKGRFAGFSEDNIGKTVTVTFQISEENMRDIATIDRKKLLDIDVKVHREKRSLDANAYYWVLLSKLAEKLNFSKSFMHNQLLRRYGQIELIDGQAAYFLLPDNDSARKTIDESEEYHLKPTAHVKQVNSKIMRTYLLLKGSHTYDTREMSVLIHGLVDEAQEMGIQTLTPEEIERMVSMWKPST